jgi:hypothetical protein
VSYLLTVFGPASQLQALIGAAQGPGFIDWNPNWVERAQDWVYQILASGGTARPAAEVAAKSLREKCRQLHDAMRCAADDEPGRLAFDLNALVPVPDDVRRRGYCPAGQRWCVENWGTRYPIAQVNFEMATERLRGARVRQVARFAFDADAPIWPVVRHVMRRWPDLTVKLLDQGLADAEVKRRRHQPPAQGRVAARRDGKLPVRGRVAPEQQPAM